jgi:hypothetical protein
MSYFTQRLANNLPRWTKARRDPSSFAQRMFSAFAYEQEERAIENTLLSDRLDLFSPSVPYNSLYRVVLTDDEAPVFSINDAGQQVWAWPGLAEGVDDDGTWTLEQVDDVIDLAAAPPTRVRQVAVDEYFTPILWQGSTLPAIMPLERVAVVVSGSTDYYPKTSERNVRASGYHCVYIEGLDENGNQISEYVNVPDDGVYLSRFWYLTLTRVAREGFDGVARLRIPYKLPYIEDRFRNLVLPDLEGPLRMKLIVDSDTRVMMITPKNKLGTQYRQGTPTEEENDDLLGYFMLRDTGGNDIELVDAFVHPGNGCLYGVSETHLYVWNHELPGFEPGDGSETLESYLELIPELHYVGLGDESPLWTYWGRVRYPVKQVQIRRVAPDGTTRYLDSARSWQAGTQTIPGRTSKTVEGTFPDFRFFTTYDQVGQWNYYITVFTEFDETTYHTAVIVGAHDALAEFDLGLGDPAEGCYYSYDGRIAVPADGTIYKFEELFDRYFIDYPNATLSMITPYNSINVSF